MLGVEDSKLRQFLLKYQFPDITRREINSALEQYHGLACRFEPFALLIFFHEVFTNGVSKQLVHLVGTIPVTYKGSIYNIPICIWIMDTHPHNAPLCYVKPTANMLIKPSRYVDFNGKIYLPYLHDWVPNTSDLLGLIQVMVVTFGEQPPVFAKGPNDVQTPYPTGSFNMPLPGGASTAAGGGPPYPPYPTQTPLQNMPYPIYPPFPVSHNMSPYPPYQLRMPGDQMSPPPNTPAAVGTGATGTITEQHIKASLLSAVEDKVRRRLREQFSQLQAEIETLSRTQQELTQGKNRLNEIISRLEKEQLELDKNITILQDKEKELEKAVTRLSEKEPIDVDEAVTTTAPLYKQLLNAFAEEAANEDAIYYMGEALRRGVIDLDVFLKQVRSLSRKQFMLRALMHKCRQKAGLAG